MFTILLHTSKTMREVSAPVDHVQTPALIDRANDLAKYMKTLSPSELEKAMNFSASMATKTFDVLQMYDPKSKKLLPALDIFLGDIYSGLQVQSFSKDDRRYANEHLFILSGLYGVLRALDTVQPYRLEMGYKLPEIPSLYKFWGSTIAQQLPQGRDILNLSAVEYTKAIFPYLDNATIISPKFLTISPKTGGPTFVTVHAKIARGAFARWVIQNKIETIDGLKDFVDLGYVYDAELSTETEPVFVAQEFKGLGLSVRLS